MSPKIAFKILLAAAFVSLIAVLFGHSHQPKPIPVAKDEVSIILSPHFDDAVLSLGGYMSEEAGHVIVANFFVDGPDAATSTSWDQSSGFKNSADATKARIAENEKAMSYYDAVTRNYGYVDFQYRNATNTEEIRSELERDIQALIASRTEKTIKVFGPATFGPVVTHPDHQIVHEALLDVERNFPRPNVDFYIYEDFPYTKHFLEGATTTLENFLDADASTVLVPTPLSLTDVDVATKLTSLGAYTSQIKAFNAVQEDILSEVKSFTDNRCRGMADPRCEIVYKFIKI